MTILVDLSILRHPYCGLGQVALGYGHWYATAPDAIADGTEVTLLVPKSYVGRFGDRVHYLAARNIYRSCPWLMPRFDVWHSIHQLSPFRPASAGCRRIVTIHDVNFIYEKQGAKRRRYLARLQRECDQAADLCFISRFAHADAARHLDLGSRPVHIIYNGVAPLTEGPQEKPAGVDGGRPYFLSLGVVKAKKNLHTLLPMMDHLPEHRLVIAGDDSGAYARSLRQQLSRHPGVSLVGTVSDAGRRWLYAHCTGLLFPSLAEGFGLPIVEAMQWGKPVFCSRSTSLPEIGGDLARYFDSFEPQAMADVVRQGLGSFSAAQADAERRRAALFSLDRHMRQYRDLYAGSLPADGYAFGPASLL